MPRPLFHLFVLVSLATTTAVIAQQHETIPAGAPSPDDALIALGEPLYQQMCGACHGAAGEGGPGGAANLTRSALARTNDEGESLQAFLAAGRPQRGMPPFAVTPEQAAQLSAVLRSFAEDAPATSVGTSDDIVLVGDAATGKAFFNGPVGRCNTCHAVVEGEASSASNLAHVASRFESAFHLQNAMVLNRSFFWSPALGTDVTAEVTYADRRRVTGYLVSVSDFKVIIRNENGRETVIPRHDGEPRVELHDRLQHHLDLLDIYKDEDIHNLTAYLATLK